MFTSFKEASIVGIEDIDDLMLDLDKSLKNNVR